MFGATSTPKSRIDWKNWEGLGNFFPFQVKTYLLGVILFSLNVYPDERWKLLMGIFYFLHFLTKSKMASSHFSYNSA
jgi:hypothetical protein